MENKRDGFGSSQCKHCWHIFTGPLLMVVPDGHVVEKCCSCKAMRTIHRGHR